jgi:hypothetical protein
MPKRVAIPYKDVRLRVVGPAADFFAYRIQRLDIPATLPSTTINELGNPRHAGIVVDIPEVTATFQAFDVSHTLYAILCGEDPDAYPGAGVDVSNLDYCDLIAYVADKTRVEHIKCIHAKYMRITDFTFTYSVDGESTEEYSCAGSEKRYLANDVVVDSGVMVSGINTDWLTYDPNQLKNGDYLLSLIVDTEWLEEGRDYSVSGKTITISGDAAYGLAVYHTQSGVLTWADISAPAGIPAAIRGKNIPVEIGLEHQYRVQSITIRGTFPNTKITEMGNTSVVGYVVDPPDITGDITVLDVDNELVALLTTGDKDDADGYGEYGVNEYEERTLRLDVIIRDPADNTTVLKTIRVPAIRVTSDGTTSNVGGQLTQTFAYMSNDALCTVYSGAA